MKKNDIVSWLKLLATPVLLMVLGLILVIHPDSASVLAAQILAVSDDSLAAKLDAQRADMAKQIDEKEQKLQSELAE